MNQPYSLRDFFDMMHIFSARCKHADTSFLRFNRRMCGFIIDLILINEYKSTTIKITMIIIQIQEARVMERTVCFLVDMSVPILVMDCLGRCIIYARYECRMCKINCIHVNNKFVRNCFCYFQANNLKQKKTKMEGII